MNVAFGAAVRSVRIERGYSQESFAKYTYYKSGPENELLESIADESGTWVIVYDTSDRVASIRKLVNGSIKKAGTEDEITSFSYETEQTTATNPEGGKGIYYYDEFGNVLEEPATQEAAAEFYAGYAGIEATAARKAIDLQDHASALGGQLNMQLGENYTGLWIDPTSGRLQIGLTPGTGYEKTAEQNLDNLGLADNTDIVPSAASTTELAAAQTKLLTRLSGLFHAGLVLLGTRAQGDAVSIEKASGLTAAQSNEIAEAVAEVTVPTQVTESSSKSLLGTPTACSGGRCTKPIRGGVRIYSPSDGCSAGFISQSIYDKKLYVMTAGHCVYGGGGVGATWKAPTPEKTEPPLGKAHSYFFGEHQSVSGEGDASIIELEPGGYWTPTTNSLEALLVPPIVIQYGTSEGLPRNERYRIYGPSAPIEAKEESVVCVNGVGSPDKEEEKEGQKAGDYPQEACGKITRLSGPVPYTLKEEPLETLVVPALTTLNMCQVGEKGQNPLKEGTSGGPVIKLNRAVGLQSGIVKKGCLDFIQTIGPAERFLHVRVLSGI